MENAKNLHIPEKEYLTLEQRKIVNWHSMILQNRCMPLLHVDFELMLNNLTKYRDLSNRDFNNYITEQPDKILELIKQLSIIDVNTPALELFGYADKDAFISRALEVHIKDSIGAAKMFIMPILEGRRFIAVEATARHACGDSFIVKVQFIVPTFRISSTKAIVSITRLSGSGHLSIRRFHDTMAYKTFMDNAPVCIHEIDEEGRLLSMNKTGLSMMGLNHENEIKGRSYLSLVEDIDKERIGTLMQRAFEGYSSEFEFTLITATRTKFFTSCFIPMDKDHVELGCIIGVTQDITERKASEEELYQMANYDPLTGLRNRINFLDAANQTLAQAVRHQYCLAFLFIDIDNLKPVNDTLGHNVGDSLLQEMSSCLKSVLRSEDLACRYGGDEFLVLLPSICATSYAARVAEKILKNLHSSQFESDAGMAISVSIGISFFPEDGCDCNTLIARADDAMYKAKRSGGNQFHTFNA